ncbi:hypothetical protein [Thermomonas paludicola]|uniref:hypothetical protein n=1 Tax=Thermomonas paludicola TaxID=2884874 RepID=UPI002113D19D|nr:hypothetical protein [Thermomonas paludicola]
MNLLGRRLARSDAQAFGERFAWRMAAMFAGMALYLLFGAVLDGREIGIVATLIALPLTYGFRLRAATEERRRGETMEDERDAAIRAQADRAFRIAASCWGALLALALSFDVGREALSANHCMLPGLLLLGVVVANIGGHLTVAMLYRRDRQ